MVLKAMPLTPLEHAVLREIVQGAQEKAILAEQLAGITVRSRKFSEAGFITELVVRPEAPRLPNVENHSLGNVQAKIQGLSHGAGFLAWMQDGRLASLEGYSYDESWPADVRSFQILN